MEEKCLKINNHNSNEILQTSTSLLQTFVLVIGQHPFPYLGKSFGQHLAEFINNKTIFLNFDNYYQYELVNGEVIKSVNVNCCCLDHEEADTKRVFHICKINRDANVIIKCSDTDISVIIKCSDTNISVIL